MKRQTELGKKAKSYMDAGSLVPDEIVLELLVSHISQMDLSRNLILDGYPRNVAQARSLSTLLGKLGIPLGLVANVEVDDSELIERILSRRTCSKSDCQAVYNTRYSPTKQPGICDRCQSPLITRSDETEEVIQHRLRVYQEQTQPLLSHYKSTNLLRHYSHKDSSVIADLVAKDVEKINVEI
jgi:adenylate kinase